MFQRKSLFVILICGLFMAAGNSLSAGVKASFDLTDLSRLETAGKEVEIVKYRGKPALRIKPGTGQGYALLKDVEFKNGVIEVDIAAIPRFTGIVFRMKGDNNYEAVYFRPQNSRHTDPIKRKHTVQYMSHPDHPWHYLRKNFPDKYEAELDIPPEEWFHVKLEVNGTTLRVFVNGSATPCLEVKGLKHGLRKGKVGVWTGSTSGGTFADFSIKTLPPTQEADEDTTYTPEQNYLFDVFANRRSVRSFKPDPVPERHIQKILDIARSAPTSGNQQPWKFLVVKDKKKLDELKKACIDKSLTRLKMSGLNEEQLKAREKRTLDYYDKTFSAPVYIVVLVDTKSKYPTYNKHDGPLAAGYLMIAARALGYGTVYYTDSIPADLTMKVLNIPERFERICITPLGIPVEWPKAPSKKPLGEFVVLEKFIKGVNYTEARIRKAIQLDEKILKKYVGKYELQPGFILTFTVEGSKIFTQATGQQKVEIFPETETEFFLKVVDAQITFNLDNDGKVIGLTLHQGGRDMPAKKTE
jgi:nitroreductase